MTTLTLDEFDREILEESGIVPWWEQRETLAVAETIFWSTDKATLLKAVVNKSLLSKVVPESSSAKHQQKLSWSLVSFWHSTMKEGFEEVNSVPTHVLCWGKFVTDVWDFSENKELVLVISGNPGLPGFYTQFCSTLFDELDQKTPVWCIGHAGHDEPNPELGLEMPALEGNGDLYNLQGQVNHKADFIRKFVPPGVKVHIVAHSIGSKISLELLKNEEISEKVHQGYLLFPTIERMMTSPNGSWFCFFDRWFFPLMQLFYYAFSYVPLIIRTVILYFFCWISSYPAFFLGTVIKMSSPTVLDKVWFMSKDEMDSVCEIDQDFGQIIKQNMHRLKFYYGTTDGWVPVDYYKQLLSEFPGIDAELCTEKIDHGFVISHGPRMARMVSDWIWRKSVAKLEIKL